MPINFEGLDDKDFIDKMRELNEYVHCLESMTSPTVKTKTKKESILRRNERNNR